MQVYAAPSPSCGDREDRAGLRAASHCHQPEIRQDQCIAAKRQLECHCARQGRLGPERTVTVTAVTGSSELAVHGVCTVCCASILPIVPIYNHASVSQKVLPRGEDDMPLLNFECRGRRWPRPRGPPAARVVKVVGDDDDDGIRPSIRPMLRF